MFPEARIVGVDLRDPNPAVLRHIDRLGLSGRVKLYYKTPQDDVNALKVIVEKEFRGPLDLVVDDCSHYYEQTRRSFEFAFPKVKPGGSYIIEDWDWAHVRTNPLSHWKSPVLSNLVFQLTSALRSAPDMINEARILKGFAAFERGAGSGSAKIDDMIFTGDRNWTKL
jgi:hypothetical protein